MLLNRSKCKSSAAYSAIWIAFGLAALGGLPVGAQSQSAQGAQPVLEMMEQTDPVTGVHAVRLMLSLPSAENGTSAASVALTPRFTVECQELNGKRDMLWFVSFGGIADPGFVAPFHGTPNDLTPNKTRAVDLKMSFEGRQKPKPFTRTWMVLTNGELGYRNAGLMSPNMESAQFFMTFLNSLPGLRIGYAKPGSDTPAQLFFPTQALLVPMRKNPLCQP